MQTSYISSAALRNGPRIEVLRIQTDLAARTQEVSTGRKADVGLALGTGTGRTVGDRVDRTLLTTLLASNATAGARLQTAQAALTDLEDLASQTLGSLIALPAAGGAARTVVIEARSALDRLADRLNASDGGAYVFAGIDTADAPLQRWDAGPEAAVAAAFTARFGFAPGAPGSELITAAAMTSFLQTDFAALFDGASWAADWSSASSTNTTARIAPSERVETGTNANEKAFRDLARGLAMVAGLGFEALGDGARQAIVDEARQAIGMAVTGVIALQAELGFAQQAVASATERMSLAEDLLEQSVGRLEGADAVEAKARIDLLTTQLEMNYALTAQIARLSILNYA